MAANISLVAEQGATFRETVQFTNPVVPPATVGTPVDFTGCSAKMQIRQGFGAATVIQELDSAPGTGITFGTGSINLLLTATQTAAIPVMPSNDFPPVTKYYYDLFVTYPSGDRVKHMVGTFTVTGAVTQ